MTINKGVKAPEEEDLLSIEWTGLFSCKAIHLFTVHHGYMHPCP